MRLQASGVLTSRSSSTCCSRRPGCRLRHGARPRTAAAATMSDRELQIKLSVASNTDKLDLSDCSLEQLPPALFDLRDLRELSLAGNQLAQLPADISQLTALEKLVVAGNRLQQLPEELSSLQHLEGLWAHGNLLQQVPDSLAQLTGLKALSLAGNRLQHIPADILCSLTALTDLNLSGNQLTSLPDPLGPYPSLVKLALHGNQLTQLPEEGWSHMTSLDELCVQGNALQQLPLEIGKLAAVTELSIADNQLRTLPDDWSGCSSLLKLHAYGNQLQQLPLGAQGLPALLPAASGGDSAGGSLRSCWLEGNPLSSSCVEQLLHTAAAAGPFRLGLDEAQLSGLEAAAASSSSVRIGVVKGTGPGYFKLQRCSPEAAEAAAAAGLPRVLVVAFGSAPGLPNWGGALSKVTAAAEEEAHRAFDVLFVVDPHRAWYQGGSPADFRSTYLDRLQQYTQQYDKVVMIGDSMGASAALLCSPHATSVLSFCPQVDLATSSIRPGQPPSWQQALTQQLHASVAASSAAIQVLTGTWQHDMMQANLLNEHAHVQSKVFSVESHRLALVLAARGELAKLLSRAILSDMGVASSKNVKLVNYL